MARRGAIRETLLDALALAMSVAAMWGLFLIAAALDAPYEGHSAPVEIAEEREYAIR